MEPETEIALVASETTGVVGGEELDLSSGSGTGLTLLCRSKRGTALFHVKLWWGCAAETTTATPTVGSVSN